MVGVLSKNGIDASSHSSRIITADLASDADLILTMEARHVQDLGIMDNDLFSRTLPLLEASDRLAGRRMTVDTLVAQLTTRDPLVYLNGERWDVDDPYKRSRRRYRKAVDQISGLVDEVIGSLES